MVKKLFKYEIKSYLRVWLPVQIVLLGIALIGRFIQFFENDTTIYDIISGSSIFMFVVTSMASFGITVALGVIRFYKNLFTGEGYLTFTLPVTPAQHIITKVVTAVLFQITSVIMVILSVCIITSGEMLKEIIKAASYLLNLAVPYLGANLGLYIVEFIALLIISTFSMYMHYYTCISLGQLFRKNRVLAAVGVYFGFYFVSQILGTVFGVAITFLGTFMEKIGLFIQEHIIGFFHGVFCGGMIMSIIGIVIYFIVIKFVISRKLNLE